MPWTLLDKDGYQYLSNLTKISIATIFSGEMDSISSWIASMCM